jgi:hypothetical protein
MQGTLEDWIGLESVYASVQNFSRLQAKYIYGLETPQSYSRRAFCGKFCLKRTVFPEDGGGEKRRVGNSFAFCGMPVMKDLLWLQEAPVIFRESATAGIAVLNRPKALNALNLSMVWHANVIAAPAVRRIKPEICVSLQFLLTVSAGGAIAGSIWRLGRQQ